MKLTIVVPVYNEAQTVLDTLDRIKHSEIPISYDGRSYEEGKKITWKDAIAALYVILRYGLFGFSSRQCCADGGALLGDSQGRGCALAERHLCRNQRGLKPLLY